MVYLWVTNGLLLLLSGVLLNLFIRYRKKVHRFSGKTKIANVPRIQEIVLEKVHSCFTQSNLGYSVECEASFIHRTPNLAGGTSDSEAWIISVLSKYSSFIFEFGTCTGKTTHHMARNSPQDAHIITITLSPHQVEKYTNKKYDSKEAISFALRESAFETFVYSGTDVEPKITQIFGDSKTFDETKYHNKCDLIFIDGSHAYSYVKSDSEKAFKMLKPGGIVLWHDYLLNCLPTEGVCRYLHEISTALPIYHVSNTTLAVYKKDY